MLETGPRLVDIVVRIIKDLNELEVLVPNEHGK